MGSGSSKTRRIGSSSASSASSTSSFSSSVGRRSKSRGVFSSSCLGSSSRAYDSDDDNDDSDNDDDQVSDHHVEAIRTRLQRPGTEPDGVKVECYQTSKVDEPDNMPCVSSNIELDNWDHANGLDTGLRADGSSSQAFSGQPLNHSSRFLSRFSFVPGSVSFRLNRAASVGSSRAYPSSPTSFAMSSSEEDLHVRGDFPRHLINSNESQHHNSLNSTSLNGASVRSYNDSSVNLVGHPANSTLSGSLQDNPVISVQDLVDNDSAATGPDVCLPSLGSHMDMEGLNRRIGDRRNDAREPAERNVRFSRTLSVGRLRDRVLRRSSFSDLTLSPLRQERAGASAGNPSLVSSPYPLSSIPNSYFASQNNDFENAHLREGRHHDLLEHRSNFLERRRRIRSQVRALQRLGSRFENLSGHERYCILSGQHRTGRCSCRIGTRDSNTNNDGGARASISRIVMLAEALFEVLDEIHQQSVVLSSRPSVSSIGSVPAPNEVVESLPVKVYNKSTIVQSEEVTQCYICLLEYEEGDAMRTLPCHHEFHKKCIDKWLKEIHRVCPLCRGDICRSDSVSVEGDGC